MGNIYIDSQSSIQFIEYSKENHSILKSFIFILTLLWQTRKNKIANYNRPFTERELKAAIK